MKSEKVFCYFYSMSSFKFTEVTTQKNTTAQFISENPQYQFVSNVNFTQ